MNPFNMNENPFNSNATENPFGSNDSQQSIQPSTFQQPQPQFQQSLPPNSIQQQQQQQQQQQSIPFQEIPQGILQTQGNNNPFQINQSDNIQQSFQPSNIMNQPFQPVNVSHQSFQPMQQFQQPTNQPDLQHSNEPEKIAYYIIDLFWLINRKIIYNQPLDQSEAHIMTIGFNASFNNLRCTLLSANQNAITPSSIIIQNANRLTGFNIYSEEALLLKTYQQSGSPIVIRERQIKSGTNWNPNITKVVWSKESILITSSDSNKTVGFSLMQEQINAFEKSLEFMLNGSAWTLAMMSVLKR